jgi:hypothetical protein
MRSIEAKGFAIGLVLAFGGIALAGCSSEKVNADPKPSMSHSVEATPTPTPTETAPAFTVESLELSASLPPEQVGKQFMANWDALSNASENKTFFKNTVISGSSYAEAAAEQAPKDTAVFTEAELVSDYATKPPLATWVKGITDEHRIALNDWLATNESGNKLDKEPFKEYTTVNSVKVVSQTPDALNLSIDATQHNNGAENTVGNETDGDRFATEAVFEKVNDTWKLDAINIVDEGKHSANQ